jgi:hypothetical protein
MLVFPIKRFDNNQLKKSTVQLSELTTIFNRLKHKTTLTKTKEAIELTGRWPLTGRSLTGGVSS